MAKQEALLGIFQFFLAFIISYLKFPEKKGVDTEKCTFIFREELSRRCQNQSCTDIAKNQFFHKIHSVKGPKGKKKLHWTQKTRNGRKKKGPMILIGWVQTKVNFVPIHTHIWWVYTCVWCCVRVSVCVFCVWERSQRNAVYR